MSFTAEYVDDGRGLLFRGEGALTCEQIIAAKLGLLSDPARLRRVSHATVVFERVTDVPLTADDIRRIVGADRQLARLTSHVVVAIAAATDLPFGVARMWQMLSEDVGWTTSVFRSRSQADLWLQERLAVLAAVPRGVRRT